METWRNTICQDKESNRCHEQDAERADLVTWNMVLSATPWEKLGFKVWVCKICLEGPQIFISCLRISDSTLGGLQIANSLWRQSMDMVWCIICIGIDVYVYLHVSMWLQVKMGGPDQPPKPTGDPDPRSRPAIQTDPDLTIQTDPDLTIQTYDPDPFVLCWLEIFFFKVLKSITLSTKCYSSTTLYYKVLLCTTKYDVGWSREFWKNLAIPFQTSFQTVPDPFQTSSMESKGSVHSQPCCQEDKTGLCVQCRIIWFQALRSRRAEKTFYESGRSRRPDHRGTIQTRLSTHSHVYILYVHI